METRRRQLDMGAKRWLTFLLGTLIAFQLAYLSYNVANLCTPEGFNAESIEAQQQPTEATNKQETNDVSTAIQLSPYECDAPMVSHFDNIYRSGSWQTKLLSVEDFYNNAKWPPRNRVSSSGVGSNLGDATWWSLDFLKKALKKHNITTVMDLPCGDVNWILDSWETDSLELYMGLDIVKTVIELNQKRFRHHSNKIFAQWDAASCSLPKFVKGGIERPVDLIHSRDVLQHLPLQSGIRFLCHVLQSGASFFMTTTFPRSMTNKNIDVGDFFHNNLLKPPFSMPKGHCTPTHPRHELDETCLYNLKEPWVASWVSQKCQ